MDRDYFRGQQRPLIEYIENKWQADPRYTSDDEWEEEEEPRIFKMMRSRRFKLYTLTWIILLFFAYVTWFRYVKPHRDVQVEFSRSLDESVGMTKGWIGMNARPKFNDMIQVKMLDEKLVPVGTKGEGRLIVVGDVHGCKVDRMSPVSCQHLVCLAHLSNSSDEQSYDCFRRYLSTRMSTILSLQAI
jgi:hypothetical protein